MARASRASARTTSVRTSWMSSHRERWTSHSTSHSLSSTRSYSATPLTGWCFSRASARCRRSLRKRLSRWTRSRRTTLVSPSFATWAAPLFRPAGATSSQCDATQSRTQRQSIASPMRSVASAASASMRPSRLCIASLFLAGPSRSRRTCPTMPPTSILADHSRSTASKCARAFWRSSMARRRTCSSCTTLRSTRWASARPTSAASWG
mmetsp:Transcript_34753/g.111634  ORF Transcript_34753/g.111634 Transcript_34753/m.111634 type:complete len:208 (-) Transcript_34753:686-1309(-)